jgi:serine/threonine-protein kinase
VSSDAAASTIDQRVVANEDDKSIGFNSTLCTRLPNAETMSTPEPTPHAPTIASDAAASRLFAGLMSDDDATAQRPPASIAGYRFLHRAGSGGQGTTWLAERLAADGSTAERVAIKFLRYSTRGFPRQYWAELDALAALRLDCLARVVASGIAEGHPWIAFEYIDGVDLAEFEPGAARDSIVEVIARAAEALARVHGAGFVHRDVKPTNIVVRSSDGTPILIDFGLACPTGTSSPAGGVVGTAEFMSPEQARGEPCTPASDQWSIAATAFLMLTGETPHPVLESSAAQLAQARSETARRARDVLPTIDAPVAAALDRALERNPRRRFTDCRMFAQALRDAARGIMPTPARRRRAPLLGAGAALVIAIAAGAYLLQVPQPASGLLIAGDFPNGSFGDSIASIGDLDDDGLDEVAIGAPNCPARSAPSWVEHAGDIAIVNGRDVAAFARGESPAITPHHVVGHRAHGGIGSFLAATGDVDGDGTPDLASLDFENRADGRAYRGVTVIRGLRAMAEPGRTDLAHHAIREIALDRRKGPARGPATADCDGDGLADLLCGAVHLDDTRRGALVIVHGARDFFESEPRRSILASPAGLRGFGCAVKVVEDDGTRLLLVSAPVGAADSGMRGHVAVFDLGGIAAAQPRLLRMLVGGRHDEWFGFALDAEIRDGALRIAVGAPGIARGVDDGGRAYLLSIPLQELDSREAPIDVDKPSAAAFVLARHEGPTAGAMGTGDLLGRAVALTPTGWAVGAPRADAVNTNAGAIILGPEGEPATLSNEQHGAEFGWSLACWKSQDSSVLLIGAPFADALGMPRSGVVRAIAFPR